jgi:hypothetical protein
LLYKPPNLRKRGKPPFRKRSSFPSTLVLAGQIGEWDAL